MLRQGDLVAVVAPSALPEADGQVQRGVAFLEEEGLRVRVGESVQREVGYIGRDRALRADDLNRQLRDPEVRAVFALVGGFSAYEILDRIDYAAIARDPKVVMGFSDITSILAAIHMRTGVVTFMGENVLWGLSERRARSRDEFELTFLEARARGEVNGDVERWRDGPPRNGRTLAGNLSTITALSGTPFAPAYNGRIFFWEDIGTGSDDINAALWHLRLAGSLDRLRGMVVGHIAGLDEKTPGLPVRKATVVAGDHGDWPIYKTGSFGHWRSSLIVPIGIRARIGGGEISFLEPGVSPR